MKKEIKLEWYVLNRDRYADDTFNSYPYCFHDTDIRPWNVFDNWPFREAAIKLAQDYKNGTMEGWEHCDNFPKNGTEYDKFKFRLMKELLAEEHGRCEYEICVAEWPPVYLNKDGMYIPVYAGQEHEPIEDVEMDKIDTYMQVLPNADIFARYVLDTVNKDE